MQTLNFNCSHCGKLMAVGMNLLGRNVRCPHCKQVVQAPATSGPPPASPPIPEPSFQIPAEPKESHESIFGEVHDDDVFGTRQPKVQMPGEQAPVPLRPAEIDATVEMPPESARLDLPEFMPSSKTEPEPLPDFKPAGANPWDGPAPKGAEAEPLGDELPETKTPYVPRERASAGGGGGGIFVWILLLYSAAATAGVAYLYFNRVKESDKVNETNTQGAHPFSAIPDLYGHFDAAKRKEVVRPKGMPEAKLDVPENLRVTVKNTLPLGVLEVTPTRIEYKQVQRFDKKAGKAAFESKTLPRPLFLLHLRVKNTSDDVVLHPTDPAFNAIYRGEMPYTGIFAGGKMFMGGPWQWPDSQYERQYVEGQENDDKPLGPREERDYVIASIYSENILAHLGTLKEGETAVWHVQLRRGFEAWKDQAGQEKEVPVSSVIGVPFTLADVKIVQ